MGPRPVLRKARASEQPISWHETEHGTISMKSKPRPKYVYSPKGDIVGEQLTDCQRAKGEVRRATRISRGSAPGRPRYEDEHIIRFPRHLPAAYTAPNELEGSYNHSMASSVSHCDDEHVIDAGRPVKGQRDPYFYGSRGQIIGRREDERHGKMDLATKLSLRQAC